MGMICFILSEITWALQWYDIELNYIVKTQQIFTKDIMITLLVKQL